MDTLRKKILNAVRGNTTRQKAVALALCIKHKCKRNSTIHDYNPYKIQKLTKIHASTFVKYLPVMVEMGLVKFDGNNSEHLVINRLHSKDNKRNVDIHRFSFKSFKDAYRSLRAFLAICLQQRKDYVLRTLQIARNPRKGQDFQKARKAVKRLVKHNVLNSVYDTARELGLSLKRIAQEVGVCVRTAENIVNDAVKKRWWVRHHHFERTYMQGVNCMYVDGYTFTTKNYGFAVYPNTYTLSRGIRSCLAAW